MTRVAFRIATGFWGALSVLVLHSAAWAQQPAAPGTGQTAPGAGVAPSSQGSAQGTGPAAPSSAEAAPAQPGQAPPDGTQPYGPYQAPPYPQQPSYQGGPGPSYPAPAPYPPPPYPTYGQGYAPPYGAPPPPPYQPYPYPYGYRRAPYGYGPRSYYGYGAPAVVPVRSLLDRPFELRLGFGLSSLHYRDLYGDTQNDGGGNWNFQLGFGLAPRFILLFGIDSVFAGSSSSYTYEQTALTVGAQVFLLQRLYLRGGIGTAARSASDDFDTYSDSRWGTAGLVGLGVELIQSYHWAVQVEWDLIATHFSSDDSTWTSNTLGLGITFF